MYDDLRNQRRFARHRIEVDFDESSPLVSLKAPDLSPDPIIPIDISAGGFCLIALYKPQEDVSFPLSIQIGSSAQVDCHARMAWAEERPSLMTRCWKMGICLEFEGVQRERFFAILERYLATKKERAALSA